MYVTQLRDRYEEIAATDVHLAAIGMGRVDMAAYFRDEFDIPFQLLVDAEQQTYKALEIRRGTLWDVVGPHMWFDFTKRLFKGQTPTGIKGDPMQLGGLAIIEPGGSISTIHRADDPSDNMPIDELLEKLG